MTSPIPARTLKKEVKAPRNIEKERQLQEVDSRTTAKKGAPDRQRLDKIKPHAAAGSSVRRERKQLRETVRHKLAEAGLPTKDARGIANKLMAMKTLLRLGDDALARLAADKAVLEYMADPKFHVPLDAHGQLLEAQPSLGFAHVLALGGHTEVAAGYLLSCPERFVLGFCLRMMGAAKSSWDAAHLKDLPTEAVRMIVAVAIDKAHALSSVEDFHQLRDLCLRLAPGLLDLFPAPAAEPEPGAVLALMKSGQVQEAHDLMLSCPSDWVHSFCCRILGKPADASWKIADAPELPHAAVVQLFYQAVKMAEKPGARQAYRLQELRNLAAQAWPELLALFPSASASKAESMVEFFNNWSDQPRGVMQADDPLLKLTGDLGLRVNPSGVSWVDEMLSFVERGNKPRFAAELLYEIVAKANEAGSKLSGIQRQCVMEIAKSLSKSSEVRGDSQALAKLLHCVELAGAPKAAIDAYLHSQLDDLKDALEIHAQGGKAAAGQFRQLLEYAAVVMKRLHLADAEKVKWGKAWGVTLFKKSPESFRLITGIPHGLACDTGLSFDMWCPELASEKWRLESCVITQAHLDQVGGIDGKGLISMMAMQPHADSGVLCLAAAALGILGEFPQFGDEAVRSKAADHMGFMIAAEAETARRQASMQSFARIAPGSAFHHQIALRLPGTRMPATFGGPTGALDLLWRLIDGSPDQAPGSLLEATLRLTAGWMQFFTETAVNAFRADIMARLAIGHEEELIRLLVAVTPKGDLGTHHGLVGAIARSQWLDPFRGFARVKEIRSGLPLSKRGIKQRTVLEVFLEGLRNNKLTTPALLESIEKELAAIRKERDRITILLAKAG